MKQILFIFLFLSITFNLFSQDTIIMRDSSIVLAKVYEVLPQEVKYKRFEMPDGPVYSESKKNIRLVIYSNGLKEEFKMEDLIQADTLESMHWKAVSLKIVRDGPYLMYIDNRLSKKKLYKLLLASNDKAILNLTLKSMKARRIAPVGLAAIPFGVVALGSTFFSLVGLVDFNDGLTFAAGSAIIAVPLALTGIINSGKNSAYKRDAVILYNMKY